MLKQKNMEREHWNTVSQRILGPVQETAFWNVQDTLQKAERMSHPKEIHVKGIFTDESENFSAAVLTQTRWHGCYNDIDKKQHEFLGFTGGNFMGSQNLWTIYEKE